MRVVAAILARWNSSRLPGKIMREVAGKPLIGHLIDRLCYCRSLDAIVVATSDESADDVTADYCRSRGTDCFRGNHDDVLDRLTSTFRAFRAEAGVVIFGDGPLVDPRIVDELVATFLALSPSIDFVGNDLESTYPAGTEAEVVRVAALEEANGRKIDPSIREHGTLFLRKHPELYRLKSIAAPPELRRPEIEIEVDEEIDLDVVSAILRHFSARPDVSTAEVIAFLDQRPDLTTQNRSVERRWRQYRADK